MSWCPSAKGFVALVMALFVSVFVPTIFPAGTVQEGVTRRSFSEVTPSTWVLAALSISVCLAACVFTLLKGKRPDKIIGTVSMIFMAWFTVSFFFLHD